MATMFSEPNTNGAAQASYVNANGSIPSLPGTVTSESSPIKSNVAPGCGGTTPSVPNGGSDDLITAASSDTALSTPMVGNSPRRTKGPKQSMGDACAGWAG